MTDHPEISTVRAVFGADKAIRSTSHDGVVTWFYRDDDRQFVAYHEAAGRHTVDLSVIESNIEHHNTDVETVPVGESPFAE